MSTSPEPPQAVFHPLIDSALRLDRGDRLDTFRRLRRAIERFPAIAEADRGNLIRAIALRDAFNRIAFRAHNAVPRAAMALARLVPIVGATELVARIPADRPIVLGLLHFGPVHFALTVATRLLAGRKIFVFHAGGDTGAASARYLADIGVVPVLTGRRGFPEVVAAIGAGTACATILCYDHLGSPGRRLLPFLGSQLAFPTGLAHFVRVTNSVAITAWWEWTRSGPRLRVGEVLAFDRDLSDRDGEDDLTDRSIRALETRVRAAPADWTEWINCYDGA